MIRTSKDGVELDVLVTPRASRQAIGPVHDGRVKVAVTAPPVDGAANAAVTKLLSKALGLSKSAASITRGHGSRKKTVLLRGTTAAEVEELCS